MQRLKIAALCALVMAIAGCGGAGSASSSGGPTTPTGTQPGGGTPTSGSPNTVTIADLSFAPGTVNVAVGTTVTWQWAACSDTGYGGYGGCVSHNVTFDDGSNIASATQANGAFSRTFASAGTFKYHCTIHGAAAMSGAVVVK
ncbi:MAG: blue (type 1) copper domain protein [Gemmatimonadetes bacterium]|nr:blue (type 1) copper domain protein [Gemmatimonadota bacterium]